MRFGEAMFYTRMVFPVLVTITLALALCNPSTAASVASDGGITLWISYDNSDAATPLDIDDTVGSGDPVGGFSCSATNSARAAQGASNAASACPGGGNSCSGRDKITTDLNRFAEYVYAASDGVHYLRRVYIADKGRSWDTVCAGPKARIFAAALKGDLVRMADAVDDLS